MPDKIFLETYPLYRKFKLEKLPDRMDSIDPVAIKMSCSICQSEQTFLITNDIHENCDYSNYSPEGVVFRTVYECKHCQKFTRYFFIKISEDKTYMMKVGQFPPWEISSDPNIEKLLGAQSSFYKKGLICESQGYGIAAFSYYRRIVEEIIDELLIEISDLMSGEDLEKYNIALEETKKTIIAQEKISLVKEVLPPILRPDGMNPLSVLHSILSEGLHAGSEEECLENAMATREVLGFLVNQVAASKASSKSFSENMRKLLVKKNKKKS